MKVAFRTDASQEIGSGHAMRCLSLATELRSYGARTWFICRHIPEYLAKLIESGGHRLIRLPKATSSAAEVGNPYAHWLGTSQLQDAFDTSRELEDDVPDWVVVDQYALNDEWESKIRQRVKHIMVIDDIPTRTHDCDILLNQNMYSEASNEVITTVAGAPKVLLGPRYALLRKEFQDVHKRVRARSGPVKRLLVFFGGMDAGNYTEKTIEALDRVELQNVVVQVVIGDSHPTRDRIVSRCRSKGYVCHVQTAQIASLMAEADLAIGAGGIAIWERCCVGLPTVAFAVAENQWAPIEGAASEGLLYAPVRHGDFCTSLHSHMRAVLDNPSLRTAISRKAMHAVDGRGTVRVAQALGCNRVEMRPATMEDGLLLYNWRSSPSIQAFSRNQTSFGYHEHLDWFRSTLSDASRSILIGLMGSVPVGMVRFDRIQDVAEVSIYVDPEIDIPGIGTELLASAEYWLRYNKYDVREIHAEVIKDNVRAHALFSENGYEVRSTHYCKRVS